MKVVLISFFVGVTFLIGIFMNFLYSEGWGPTRGPRVFYLGLWPAILYMIIPLSGPPCYTPVILPKYLEKYQVFTMGARLLYLPVKLKRVYNWGPRGPGFSEI